MKRHTCIKCGKKLYESKMNHFQFSTYVNPVKPIYSMHWACNKTKERYSLSCYESIQRNVYQIFVTAVNVSPELTIQLLIS